MKTYTCSHFIGLIVGGQRTKTGEFPHMAGKNERIFKHIPHLELRIVFFQPSVGDFKEISNSCAEVL